MFSAACSALLEMLRAGLIDLVFANEDEACALLDVLAAADEDAAAAAAATAGRFSPCMVQSVHGCLCFAALLANGLLVALSRGCVGSFW